MYRVHQLQMISPSLSCSIVFQFSSKVEVLISLFACPSVLPCGQSGRQISIFDSFFFFFFLTITRSGRRVEIRWSICVSKSQRILYVSFSRTDSGFCIYHFFLWSIFNFLHNSQWITLPTQSCLVLYSLCPNLLLILMWLIVSSLSPHNLHQLFYCVLSILALT